MLNWLGLTRIPSFPPFPPIFRITGAKTEQDLSEALTKLYPVLMEYRKANVAPMPGLASAPPALPNTSAASAGGALEMAPLPGAGGVYANVSHRRRGAAAGGGGCLNAVRLFLC